MSEITPRMAVAYHFFKDYDTTGEVFKRIRSTYDGPLSLAEDFMVWNVTKDEITERLAVVDDHTWSPPLASPAEPPDMADRKTFSKKTGVPEEAIGYSEFIESGTLDVDDVLRPIYKEAGEAVGREVPYPADETKIEAE